MLNKNNLRKDFKKEWMECVMCPTLSKENLAALWKTSGDPTAPSPERPSGRLPDGQAAVQQHGAQPSDCVPLEETGNGLALLHHPRNAGTCKLSNICTWTLQLEIKTQLDIKSRLQSYFFIFYLKISLLFPKAKLKWNVWRLIEGF